MILFVTFLCLFASICSARPNYDQGPKNMITVPPNCPVGQQWVNGQCREIWRSEAQVNFVSGNDDSSPVELSFTEERKTIDVPPNIPNCPEGQEYVNGECRDVWSRAVLGIN
ncbi:unnamed protein product [Chrysodeixis includens]|uniref:Uncharacterized protein n=1 Tax=Chrysodeixis includens TaxID=689277 RepID=A0A9P0FZD2_CHRIL|nr:unnamed protein product [Chrysodeixis includens]